MIKRITSAVLCMLLLLLPFSIVSAISESEMSASTFAQEVRDFLDENRVYEIDDISPSGEEGKVIHTNRLIVSNDSNNPLEDNCGAVAKLEGFSGIHVLQYESKESANRAYDVFNSKAGINYVQYDEIITMDESDYTEDNWHNNTDLILESNSNSISYGAETVKSQFAISKIINTGLLNESVIVAVIDTGVDATHPFFQIGNGDNRILPSSRPKDNNPCPETRQYFHGTHVAGIITDNSPQNVRIRSYNYFYYMDNTDEMVATTVTLFSEIELAISDNVDVINLSLSGYGNQPALNSAVNNALSNSIIVVAAAGNDDDEASRYHPGNYEPLITVAATNMNDRPWASYPGLGTNYGSIVDVSAPGHNIYSSIPNDSYDSRTGTSMAAPFVSAAAAILKTFRPSLTCSQVCQILKSTATVPNNWDASKYGAGIVNFEKMLSHPLVNLARPSISIITNGKYSISGPSDADIYYTTDGSTPTENSTKYIAPFTTPSGCKAIKAIAVSENLKSDITTYMLQVVKNIEINYKKTVKLDIPKDASVRSIFSDNTEIVSIADPMKPTVYGEKRGNATVTVNFDGGRVHIYNITVKFSFWQWIQYIFLFGFIWM